MYRSMQQHKFMRAASLHWSSLGGFASRTLSPMSCTRLLPLAVAFGSCVTSNSLHGLPLIIAYPFFLSSSGCTLVVAPSSTISLCAHFVPPLDVFGLRCAGAGVRRSKLGCEVADPGVVFFSDISFSGFIGRNEASHPLPSERCSLCH